MTALACISAVAVLAWTLGLFVGRARAKEHEVKASSPELSTLQGRMVHARNMGMRLQELASNLRRLQEEQAHLQLLQDLKNEVQWLLSQVESELTEHHKSDPERLEDMLDATGKALRLVLDAGRRPKTTWEEAQRALSHLHKTLCLIRNLPAPKPIKIENQYADNHINQAQLIQLMIESHRLGRTDVPFPFAADSSGVIMQRKDHPPRTVLWSQEMAED